MTDARLKRGARAWMLFDWANQPFYTLVVTFIFGPYVVGTVIPDPVAGQAYWADLQLFGALGIVALAPVLGAIADQSGPRKPWIAAFSAMFVAGCAGLWLAEPGMSPLWPLTLFFVLAFLGSEFSLTFTNAMLPDLGPRTQIGAISGAGWALGYAGGVVALALVLALIAPAGGGETTLAGIRPIFGLDPAQGEPERAVGPLTALWYAVFVIPLFVFTPDAPRRPHVAGAVRAGLRSLTRHIRALPAMPGLALFLLASMIYRDGLVGLFAFGGIYAKGVLGWGVTQLGLFGIVAALTGVFGALTGGWADRAFGPKPVVVTGILGLIAVAVVALGTSRVAVLGVPIAPGSALPDMIFYGCGGLLGAAAGAVQAASRTMLVHQAAGRLPMTEAFGLYALSGKATAFLAPLLIGLTTRATQDQALGVSPVVALFVLGLVVLYWVKTPEEARA